LRCRHCGAPWQYEWEYCPQCSRNYGGALYPETQTAEEIRDSAELIRRIHAAFDDVALGDGLTLHEADLEGVYLDERVRLEARAKDKETRWHEVPDWKLERASSPLHWLDPEGWCFYIPAYLRWALRNWRTTDSITAYAVVWHLVSPERKPALNCFCLSMLCTFRDFIHAMRPG
jgi:hypothetical protein